MTLQRHHQPAALQPAEPLNKAITAADKPTLIFSQKLADLAGKYTSSDAEQGWHQGFG